MNPFQSINPFTGTVIGEYAPLSASEIESKIEQAHQAYGYWRTQQVENRTRLLMQLAGVFRQHQLRYATLITQEMGKPITESLAEIEKCALTCDYYAEHAATFLCNKPVVTEALETYVQFQPLGVILCIMPWNFPFWQVMRFATATLAAGNTVLLKHASNVMGCALALEEAFAEAGFPPGVFQALAIGSEPVTGILGDFRIKGVSLTGSEKAGRSVAALAGQHLKKSVLELGGSDAFIVLADADINKAADIALQSRFQNGGQVCISAKRFIVEQTVKEAFVARLLEKLPQWIPSDPMRPATKMGPLARPDLADTIETQYINTITQGAIALTAFHREGCLVHPVLLDHVQPGMTAFEEETFGPIGTIITTTTEQQAIALANQSYFGLGASLFTRDLEKARYLAGQLQAGSVFINDLVRSDPRFPIGGINNSGYGRELGEFGLHEFVNIKSVNVN